MFDGTYGMAMNTTLRHKIVGQKTSAKQCGVFEMVASGRADQNVRRTDLMLCRSLPILLSKWTTRDIHRRAGCRPGLACHGLVPIRVFQVGLEICFRSRDSEVGLECANLKYVCIRCAPMPPTLQVPSAHWMPVAAIM